MASTLAVLAGYVRHNLKSRDKANYLVRTPALYRKLESVARRFQMKHGLGEAWVSNAVALTANADQFSLDNSVQYASVMWLRLVSNGLLLRKRTVEEIERRRSYLPDTAAARAQIAAIPSDYCLWEDSGQVVRGRLWPPTRAADTLDLFRSVLLSDLSTDAATTPFSQIMLEVLALQAALEIGLAALPEELARHGLNPDVFGEWKEQIQSGLRDERIRRDQLRSVGRTLRWVA